MYELIKQVINSKRYELASMLKKIDTVWIQGDITDEQKTELVELAQTNAMPENSYASYDKQIADIYNQIAEIKETVNANAQGMAALKVAVENLGGMVTEPEQPAEPADEYPKYKQPTGAHDAYQVGDKITWDGGHYECIFAGCVWNPTEYPQGWKKLEEKAEA